MSGPANTPSAPFRSPATGPSAAQIADRDLWDKAAEGSLASVQAAAEKWRTGLAAFVTLVTGGLLIKGPEASSDLTRCWLTVLTVTGALGLGLAVIGLWKALAAAAGTPSSLRYEDVISRHGSFRQYQVAAAAAAVREAGRRTEAHSVVAAVPRVHRARLVVGSVEPDSPGEGHLCQGGRLREAPERRRPTDRREAIRRIEGDDRRVRRCGQHLRRRRVLTRSPTP